MQKDFGQAVIYLLPLISISHLTLVYTLPLCIFFLIGFSHFVIKSEPKVFNFGFMKNMAVTVTQNANDFKKARTYIELLLFFYSVIFFMKIGFMIPVSLFMYLRLKGSIN